MKNIGIVSLIFASLIFTQCQKTPKRFLITKDSVGNLKRASITDELSAIYTLDSIVRDTASGKLFETKKIRVYEKGGTLLLSLRPSMDSVQKIVNIQIYDTRYLTEKGIGINSTFRDIKDNYSIKKIITTFNNIVILLKDNDMYFTIDKKELPANIRYNTKINVEAVQIPDVAKIKYFMIGWE